MTAAVSTPRGKRTVHLTNQEKVLFPEDGITKGDLVAYYRKVSRWILPYLAARPLTLQRWPNGIHGPSFFEKEMPRGMPDWVSRVRVDAQSAKRGAITFPVCNDQDSLAYFANLAAITMHVWYSREGSLDVPDYVLLDLDPFDDCTVATLAKVALGVRDACQEIGLSTLVKTSGGTGLHVIVPLASRYGWDMAKGVAELVAHRLAALMPEQVTLERSLAKRARGAVYVDYLQVAKGKTVVPPFVVRARPGAPVSMPITWDQVAALGRRARARTETDTASVMRDYRLDNVPALLEEHGDPWAKERKPQRLEGALERAAKMWRDG